MDEFGSAQTAVSSLAAESVADSEDLNEATTRLRLIDRLLMDGLGWRASDITAEKHGPEGYVDYSLGRPASSIIVEAKREGISFTVPPGLAGRRLIDIKTLREDPPTAAAIEQVTKYCQSLGVPIAVITNGTQYIAFYASRQDGVPPFSGQALCFHTLQEIADDFSIAWAMLSRAGVAERHLHRLLMVGNRNPRPPAKLAESIPGYPGFRPRSELETNLRMLGNAFVRDVENPQSVTDEFYRQCYCNTGALSQYALVSREVLLDRYGPAADDEGLTVAPVTGKRGRLNPLLQGDIFTAMKSSPVVVLGDVGVGKTMFLQHFLRIDGADALRDSLVFYIDFGNKRTVADTFDSFVSSEIERQLIDIYGKDIHEASFVRAVYNRELNQFAKSVFGAIKDDDPPAFRLREAQHLSQLEHSPNHLLRALKHLRSGASLVAILDNIDQWPDEDQDRVFLIAQALASQWPVTTFVSLRPETFHRSRAAGTLSAYQLRVFTVAPPRISDVVHKRLEYAKKLAEQETAESLPPSLQISIGDLVDYLKMLDSSFQTSEALREIVDNLSGGNVRAALAMVARFVGSPYVSTDRILESERLGRHYVVPPHEFLRASFYGDHSYFDPARTDIPNVFDISSSDAREHFLLVGILGLCRTRKGGRHGLVDAEEIFRELGALGFSADQVAFQLDRASEKRLVDAAGAAGDQSYRTNQLGAYAALRLPGFFTYLDAVIVDTPIVDVKARRSILDVRTIDERIERAESFLNYLDASWSQLGGLAGLYDWAPVSGAAHADVADTRQRVERSRVQADDT